MQFGQPHWIFFDDLPEFFQQKSANNKKQFFSNQFLASSYMFEHVERIFDNTAGYFWNSCQEFSDRCPNMVKKVFNSAIFLTKSLWTCRMQFWQPHWQKVLYFCSLSGIVKKTQFYQKTFCHNTFLTEMLKAVVTSLPKTLPQGAKRFLLIVWVSNLFFENNCFPLDCSSGPKKLYLWPPR